MSLRPGMLASTSRFALTQATRGVPAAGAAPAAWVRAQSNKAATKGTVQGVDEQMRERERMMRRLPVGVDMTAHFRQVVIEPTVDPPTKLSWAASPVKFYDFVWNKLKRNMTSGRAASDMTSAGLVPPAEVGFFAGWRKRLGPLVAHLQDEYTAFNAAQASGDMRVLRRLSIGKALDRATAVASTLTKQNAQWKLVSVNAEPQIASVRFMALDVNQPKVAQIVLRFDTTQALTTGTGAKRATRQSRVVENIVFDRSETPGDPWVIKDRLEVTMPECAQ